MSILNITETLSAQRDGLNDINAQTRNRTRYLGSKARISREIMAIIGLPSDQCELFIDVFSGTGSVSRVAAECGWHIRANDHLLSAAIMTTANLIEYNAISFRHFGSYNNAIECLNSAPTLEGFIYREYTPSGMSKTGHIRKYFTENNGKRIDGMRKQIEQWYNDSIITATERSLLVADLLTAANNCANTAGTYGCFLSHWNEAALRRVEVECRSLLSRRCQYEVLNVDVLDVPSCYNDIAYLDPPYTKRQYSAYYHILETIAVGDDPDVEGVTGLRPWRVKCSDFCYKTKALQALERVIISLKSRVIFLSYSSEGHISLHSVEALFKQYGKVRIYELSDIGRYRSNKSASLAGSTVTEFLVKLEKSDA